MYEWIDTYCKEKTGAQSDFKEEWHALRYRVGEKLFAMVGQNKEGKDIITLRCEPEHGEMLREKYDSITAGYYMNKVHWNSVVLDETVPNDVIKDMIERSYSIIFSKLTKKLQSQILSKDV